MATADIPQVSKIWNDSSFVTQTFDYQWTIRNVKTRLAVPNVLKSPYIYPDIKVNGYKTKWQLIFDHTGGLSHHSISLQLNMCYEGASYAYTPKTGADIGMWAAVKFCVLKPVTDNTDKAIDNNSPDHLELFVKYVPREYDASKPLTQTINIKYKTDVGDVQFAQLDHNFVKRASYNDTLTIYCKVDIHMLNDPQHKLVTPPSPEPEFDLSKTLEDARKNNLFTDVILVARGKEFKAHKVVLASQSTLFNTRLQQTWPQPIEMGDLTPDILEAMLSFMYTGKVANTSQLATQLLPAAEEYGLVALRQICEKVLSESLNAKNVIENVILADTHNADQLMSGCMSYITKNPSGVQKSEGWKKLGTTREKDGLRLNILEEVAKSLVK